MSAADDFRERGPLVLAGLAAGLLVGIVLWATRKKPALAAARATHFGAELAEAAARDLGVAETSPNSGPRIDEMLGNYSISHANWCAAAVGTWIRDAAKRRGVAPPITGSASSKITMAQFQDPSNLRVAWVGAAELRADPSLVAPGMVSVWTRGDPAGALGHIGVVAEVLGDGAYASIEGNSGPDSDRVQRNVRRIDDANLLGMGIVLDDAAAVA